MEHFNNPMCIDPKDAMTLEKCRILRHLNNVCIDPEDAMTLDKWEDLTIEQLRTVSLLLNDHMINALEVSQGARGHCYLLENLYKWISRNTEATNPMTRQPITTQQRQDIVGAYNIIHPEMAQREHDKEILERRVKSAFSRIRGYGNWGYINFQRENAFVLKFEQGASRERMEDLVYGLEEQVEKLLENLSEIDGVDKARNSKIEHILKSVDALFDLKNLFIYLCDVYWSDQVNKDETFKVLTNALDALQTPIYNFLEGEVESLDHDDGDAATLTRLLTPVKQWLDNLEKFKPLIGGVSRYRFSKYINSEFQDMVGEVMRMNLDLEFRLKDVVSEDEIRRKIDERDRMVAKLDLIVAQYKKEDAERLRRMRDPFQRKEKFELDARTRIGAVERFSSNPRLSDKLKLLSVDKIKLDESYRRVLSEYDMGKIDNLHVPDDNVFAARTFTTAERDFYNNLYWIELDSLKSTQQCSIM